MRTKMRLLLASTLTVFIGASECAALSPVPRIDRRVMGALPSFDPSFIPLKPFKSRSPGGVFGPFLPRVSASALYERVTDLVDPLDLAPAAVRSPLLVDWRGIESRRSGLRAWAAALDRRDAALYGDGLAIEDGRAALRKRADTLNGGIGEHNARCARQFFDPPCVERKKLLLGEKSGLEADIGADGVRARAWNKRYDDVYGGAARHAGSASDWEALMRGFLQREQAALQDAGAAALDVSAQGEDMGSEKTVKFRGRGPICDVAALHALVELEGKLSAAESRQRTEAFRDARLWVMNKPVEGWFPSKTFQDKSRTAPGARVNVKILAGRAFVQCPAGSK